MIWEKRKKTILKSNTVAIDVGEQTTKGIDMFKYLGLVLQKNNGCDEDMKYRNEAIGPTIYMLYR